MRKFILTTAAVFMAAPAFADMQMDAAESAAAIEPAGYADDNRHGVATSSQIIKKLTLNETDSTFFVSPGIDLSIHFKTGSAELTEQSRTQLVELAEALNNPELLYGDYVIEGHTDSVGDAGLNQSLSQRRAAAVVRALNGDHGVDTSKISVKGYGESKPVASNDTAAGRAENRRVTIVRTN